jgi:hypothetical protein
MSGAVISRVQMGAAHDGDAEIVLTLRYDNGGETLVALDHPAANHLMTACAATDPSALLGQGWERVRDALEASSNRYAVAGSGGPDNG